MTPRGCVSFMLRSVRGPFGIPASHHHQAHDRPAHLLLPVIVVAQPRLRRHQRGRKSAVVPWTAPAGPPGHHKCTLLLSLVTRRRAARSKEATDDCFQANHGGLKQKSDIEHYRNKLRQKARRKGYGDASLSESGGHGYGHREARHGRHDSSVKEPMTAEEKRASFAGCHKR